MVTFPQHRYCVSLSSRYGLNGEKHVLRFNCGQSYHSVFTIASNCSDNNMHIALALPSTSRSLCQAAVYSLLADVAWQQSLLIGEASASPSHGSLGTDTIFSIYSIIQPCMHLCTPSILTAWVHKH